MTIQKAIQIYLDWKEGHTNTAFMSYKKPLENFMRFLTPESCLMDITEQDITVFQKSMKEVYAPSTIAYITDILKNFFVYWNRLHAVKLNPENIKRKKFISPEKPIVDASDFEDMNLTLDERYFNDLEKKLVIHLLWDTGMRVSELLDIKLKDISEQKSNGLRTAKILTRKTMRYNLVVWGSDTNRLLNNYLGLRLCMAVSSEYLLINPKTEKPYTVKSIQRWVKQISEDAMLDKKITPHSFRHGKANDILEQGGTVRDVSAILRHVSPESSFKYLQLSETRYLQTASKYLKTA